MYSYSLYTVVTPFIRAVVANYCGIMQRIFIPALGNILAGI